MTTRETAMNQVLHRRARVALRPDPPAQQTRCWHCGSAVGAGKPNARYLYRGDRPNVAIVEDWYRCGCGAFQNVRRATEITVRSLNRYE
ncbi:MAG TPA: hypothetical protein VMA36_18610 [Candidatus Limnocylindria bacterium]|jgi:hypothetical protein|nr:hypothetical protein [Candidatus Limnocylindria bacterium]